MPPTNIIMIKITPAMETTKLKAKVIICCMEPKLFDRVLPVSNTSPGAGIGLSMVRAKATSFRAKDSPTVYKINIILYKNIASSKNLNLNSQNLVTTKDYRYRIQNQPDPKPKFQSPKKPRPRLNQ